VKGKKSGSSSQDWEETVRIKLVEAFRELVCTLRQVVWECTSFLPLQQNCDLIQMTQASSATSSSSSIGVSGALLIPEDAGVRCTVLTA
jgi:hypothetical protein